MADGRRGEAGVQRLIKDLNRVYAEQPALHATDSDPAGFRWLVDAAPSDDPVVADRLAQLEIEITGLRGMCRQLVHNVEAGTAGPADASIVKLYYSEVLQRLTDSGAEIGGPGAHTVLAKPLSSGWESGSWVLDFLGSWEWTIPGGSSEIQRTIIGERGLGLPREPSMP